VRGASEVVLTDIGFALAAAAVVELAYTLFTHGPDEALNPLILGVGAAILIQLNREPMDVNRAVGSSSSASSWVACLWCGSRSLRTSRARHPRSGGQAM
jgi:hypothetical protein